MPFPPQVREQALVKSRRRCCVCHEFAGRAVNVHHIIQEADRGPNTLDNAIVLCLRCHAEAGHFNSRHPIGTKYSPSELKKHRDSWWALTERGQIEIASAAVDVHWRRKLSSSLLHTYQLIVELQNGSNSINDWKLHIELPSLVPARTQDSSKLQDSTHDGVIYNCFETTGGRVFPGESLEIIGTGLT